ncbi:MAG: protein tyrosine phosphatase [Spirochaetia bacterium]|nr:protein tyrosine phosphatase [Spirochaetia bacterium]
MGAERQKILFVCSANRDRSPRAEKIYKDDPGFEVKSAGTEGYARTRVNARLVAWADIIFVMEECHRAAMLEMFPGPETAEKINVLGIPDIFHFMDPALVSLLKEKVEGYL